MMSRFFVLIGLTLSIVQAAVSLSSSASADDINRRFALVIGNAKYPDADAPLKEAVADMHAVADELKRAGFDVAQGENLGRDAMQRTIEALYGKVKPGSAVLIFFSGFGIQSGRQTFLIPVDGQIWTEADVRRDGISLDTMLGEINSRGATVKIAILDASRRNPFERRFRNYSLGLAPATAPQGSLVMYSAAPGTVVANATSDHSLFVNELLKEIRVPGLTAEEALNRTRVGVSRASQGEQVPWFSSSLVEEFSFGPGPSQGDAGPMASLPKPSPAADPKVASLDPKPLPQVTPPAIAAPSVPDLPKQSTVNPPAVAAPATPSLPPSPPVQPQASLPAPPAPVAPLPQTSAAPQVSATPQAPLPAPTPATASPAPDPKLAALSNDPAIRDLTNLINDNPNDEAAYYKRGQIYASKGAYAPALGDFDAALKLNPKDVEALNNRCWVRSIVGELQSALKDCNDALQLRPNFVDALDSRGLVYLKLGMTTNALTDFDAALKLNPKLASSLYGRGLARQRSGLAAAGDRDIQAAKQISPEIAGEFVSYGVR